MPTLRDKALRLFAKARTNLVDAKAGLRLYRVFIRVRVPSDGRGGLGCTWTVTDTELLEKPRMRRLAGEQVRGVGRVPQGTWVMDRITPLNEAGTVGTAYDAIDFPPAAQGTQVRVVLVGEGMPDYTPASAGPPAVQPSGGGEFTILQGKRTPFGNEYVLVPVAGKQAST